MELLIRSKARYDTSFNLHAKHTSSTLHLFTRDAEWICLPGTSRVHWLTS